MSAYVDVRAVVFRELAESLDVLFEHMGGGIFGCVENEVSVHIFNAGYAGGMRLAALHKLDIVAEAVISASVRHEDDVVRIVREFAEDVKGYE